MKAEMIIYKPQKVLTRLANTSFSKKETAHSFSNVEARPSGKAACHKKLFRPSSLDKLRQRGKASLTRYIGNDITNGVLRLPQTEWARQSGQKEHWDITENSALPTYHPSIQ